MEKDFLLIYSDDFKSHSPEPYEHPEGPERLEKALDGLAKYRLLERAKKVEPPKGNVRIFLKVHSEDYFNFVISKGKSSVEWLDGDTYISPGTHRALERLAGVPEVVERELGSWNVILVLPRPPGHHAGKNGRGLGAPTLGFCIFNISSLIAKILEDKGFRVVMIDFDAHHGNGSQDIFYNDDSVVHIDIHQDSSTIYPGTGFPWQTGEGKARGTKININIPPFSGDDIFKDAANNAVKFLKDHDPEVIVVDAGFDGYLDDNYMVSLNLSSSSFNYLGKILSQIDVPKVVVVEGGYNTGLKRALPSFLAGLLRKNDPVNDGTTSSTPGTWDRYRERLRELTENLKS